MSDKYHENIKEGELTDIVELVGDSGDVLNFYHIGTIEYNDEWFAFFQPSDNLNGVDPDEFVVFKLDGNEKEEVLLRVDDEQLLEEVYAEFMRELEEGEESFCEGNCEGCHGCDGKND